MNKFIYSELRESEFVRYIVAGVFNNVVGYSTFLVALHNLNASAQVANILAYVVGLQAAFLLNRFYVFKGAEITTRVGFRFIFAFALSFALNQAVLQGLIRLYNMSPEISQIFAMAIYVVAFYLLNKHLVWGRSGL